jgi:signal transduction histidine kinase
LYPAGGFRAAARTAPELDLEHARRLEVGFVALRWFVVAFGVVQTVVTVSNETTAPGYVAPVAFVLIAALAMGNVLISALADSAETRRRIGTVGLAAFSLDIAVMSALVWTFTNSPQDSAWVVAFILPLEGAIRYQVKGALVPVAITLIAQTVRELSFEDRFAGYHADLHAVAFRIGVEVVIAIVAGIMARSFRREIALTAERAQAAEESAVLAELAVERLRELDEMKSDFVAITSHELRSPLAAVRGFVDTLVNRLDRLSDEEVREFLEIIDQQSERLARLVEDLLVASRIDAGELVVEPTEVEVAVCLDTTVRGLGDERHRVRVELAPGLPEAVSIDPNRLDQILRNLLHNALKFSPAGSEVVLRAGVEDSALVVSVVDRGIGIAIGEQERIFDRFHQADPATTRSAEGAGLGLYITRQLVEAMGGSIGVSSEPGLGSTFSVRLPVSLRTAPARPFGAVRSG